MFMRRPRHRIFDYTPRFYKPETDGQERRKRRLGFSRQRKISARKKSPILWIIFIIVVICLILKLRGNI